jgi:hypothetical protein
MLDTPSIVATSAYALAAIAEPSMRSVASQAMRTTLTLGDPKEFPDQSLSIPIEVKKAVAAAPVKSMKKMSMRAFERAAGQQSQQSLQKGKKRVRDEEDDQGGRLGLYELGDIGKTFERTLAEEGLAWKADASDATTSHAVNRETNYFYRPLDVSEKDVKAKQEDDAEEEGEEDENELEPTGNAELSDAYYYGGSLVPTGDLEEGVGELKNKVTGMQIVRFMKQSEVRSACSILPIGDLVTPVGA